MTIVNRYHSGLASMKTIQITIDEPLLIRVDARAAEMEIARSGLIRRLIEDALADLEEAALVERHRLGYERFPPGEDEFLWPIDQEAWENM